MTCRIAIAALFPLAACTFEPSTRPEGTRVVSGDIGRVTLGRQVTGLQVAAVAISGGSISVFPSAVFDPSRDRSSFATVVDGTVSFVVVLQVPSASTTGPGTLVAALAFSDGFADATLIPPGDVDIDLGSLTLADGILVVSDEANPLAHVDTDADGSPDLSDTDDDGDEVPDATDPDRAGDGIDDAEQLLGALPDSDEDRVPDAFDSD